MKYQRLTREQLIELHPEFSNFLATQSIDKKEWDDIKLNKPQVAEQEIDVFSDLIWEKALSNVQYIDHFSKNYIFLFKCFHDQMFSIIIKTNFINIDFTTKEGINWLSENLFTDYVEINKGRKNIEDKRNKALFELIKKGVIISNGNLFSKFENLLKF
jgi:hypothetical protein